MAHKKHTDHKIAAEHDVWRALMLIIYMVLLGVILSLGYLLVGHHLHSYWHSESLSPEQLQKVQQQASARLSQQQELADWDRVVDGVHQAAASPPYSTTSLSTTPHSKLVGGHSSLQRI